MGIPYNTDLPAELRALKTEIGGSAAGYGHRDFFKNNADFAHTSRERMHGMVTKNDPCYAYLMRTTHQRLYDMILPHGTEEVYSSYKSRYQPKTPCVSASATALFASFCMKNAVQALRQPLGRFDASIVAPIQCCSTRLEVRLVNRP